MNFIIVPYLLTSGFFILLGIHSVKFVSFYSIELIELLVCFDY